MSLLQQISALKRFDWLQLGCSKLLCSLLICQLLLHIYLTNSPKHKDDIVRGKSSNPDALRSRKGRIFLCIYFKWWIDSAVNKFFGGRLNVYVHEILWQRRVDQTQTNSISRGHKLNLTQREMLEIHCKPSKLKL